MLCVFETVVIGILTEATSKKIEAFEMWIYRRGFPGRKRKTNREVFQRMNKKPEIMNAIKVRKLEYLGHVMRSPDQGKVYVVKRTRKKKNFVTEELENLVCDDHNWTLSRNNELK